MTGRIRSLTCLALALFSSALLAQVPDPVLYTVNGVQPADFVHGPSAGIDVYLDGVLLSADLPFAAVSTAHTVGRGRHELTVFPAFADPDARVPLARLPFCCTHLRWGHRYSVIFHLTERGLPTLTLMRIGSERQGADPSTDLIVPASASVQFFHGSAEPAIVFNLRDPARRRPGDPVLTLANGEDFKFNLESPSDLRVYLAHVGANRSLDSFGPSINLQAEPGRRYLLYRVGSIENGRLIFQQILDF